jgi:hypothetical protein
MDSDEIQAYYPTWIKALGIIVLPLMVAVAIWLGLRRELIYLLQTRYQKKRVLKMNNTIVGVDLAKELIQVCVYTNKKCILMKK